MCWLKIIKSSSNGNRGCTYSILIEVLFVGL